VRRASLFAFVLVVWVACGGKSESGPSDASSGFCGLLVDSGIQCYACISSKCCAELNACFGAADGQKYENCWINCILGRDGGPDQCQQTCLAQYPAGGNVCIAYTTCASDKCITPGC
jgi:hypothetical protein